MTNLAKRIFDNLLLCAFFAVLLYTPTLCQAQDSKLRIVSPREGAIVHTGETFDILVISSANSPFNSVAVISQDPFGMRVSQGSTPAHLSIEVPADIKCGKYSFIAMGIAETGKPVESAPVEIDIEPGELPSKLMTLYSFVSLTAGMDGIPITILAELSDKTVLDITESSHITFESVNKGVALVDENGFVTPVAAGTGSIKVLYRSDQGTSTLSIPVAVTAPPDPPSPKYTLSIRPAAQTLSAGDTVTFEVSMHPTTPEFHGEDVSLRLAAFIGASGTFSPSGLTEVMHSSTLTISIARNVAAGVYPIEVMGNGPSGYSTAEFKLTIYSPPN
jgi:hypothetical protein